MDTAHHQGFHRAFQGLPSQQDTDDEAAYRQAR